MSRWPMIPMAISTSRRWSHGARFAGLEGLDLAKDVTCAQSYRWDEMRWAWPTATPAKPTPSHKVVRIDYGAKRNILRCLGLGGL